MFRDQILNLFPSEVRKLFSPLTEDDFMSLQEIRLRCGKPIGLLYDGEEYGICDMGLCRYSDSITLSIQEVETTIQYMSKYSLYALENDLKRGFMTLEGGHRLGVAGQVVVENDIVKSIMYISSLNLRICHEVVGCSNKLMNFIVDPKRDKVAKTLIVSPPKCGKTTLIRDIARNLSDGWGSFEGCNVGIVDERSEIAGCYRGIPQSDVGSRTDVMDKCPKAEGIRMLLRSMAPRVIIVDEIGRQEDYDAIQDALCAGVSVISSIHANDIDECLSKPTLCDLIRGRYFERIIILSNTDGVGTVSWICDTKDVTTNLNRKGST